MTLKTLDADMANFPDWAMCALFNGDESGLTNDEAIMIDSWIIKQQEKCKQAGYSMPTYNQSSIESYFCARPAFGLACMCYEITVTYFGTVEEQK